MKYVVQILVLITGLSVFSTPLMASSHIDKMSNIQVSEYAARMADVMEKIQTHQLCESCDIDCERAEFTRHGIAYEDRDSVKKRLILMMGRLY